MSSQPPRILPRTVPAVKVATGKVRWMIVGGVTGGLLLYLCWSVISVLVASAVLAYLLDPLVQRLEQKGLSRSQAVALLTVGGGFILLLLLLLVVPDFISQVEALSVNLTPYAENLYAKVGPLKAELKAKYGIVIPVDLRDFAKIAPQYLQKLSPDTRDALPGYLQLVFHQLTTNGIGFALKAFNLSLIFPFTWFLLTDWPMLLRQAETLVPARWRPELYQVTAEIDGRIFAFVKGQILVCTLLGILYTTGLLLTGIDLAISVGMISGFLFLVPYLGAVVGIFLSCTLALLKFGPDWHILGCLGTFAVAHFIEGSFLTPFLVGNRVGLHPMVVIVALLVGGDLLGIWGLVLAVPLTAVLAVIGERMVDKYRQSKFFTGL